MLDTMNNDNSPVVDHFQLDSIVDEARSSASPGEHAFELGEGICLSIIGRTQMALYQTRLTEKCLLQTI